jgi:mRNA interferase MazF
VYLISLDPTTGGEIKKTRPCVIVSPDELNGHLSTFLVAPMTTAGQPYPIRLPCRYDKTEGFVVLDKIRTDDRRKLVRSLGRLTPTTISNVMGVLSEILEE